MERRAMGRGGPEHRRLQAYICKRATKLGWSVFVGRQIEGTRSFTDILIERDGQTVACETAVSGTPREADNLRKNLQTKYNNVILIAQRRDRLRKVRRFAKRVLSKDEFGKVIFLLPRELSIFLQGLDRGFGRRPEEERTVCGYRIKRNYVKLSPIETRMRMDALVRIITDHIRRSRSK